MISETLIDLIQDSADELTGRLIHDVINREETEAYARLPEKEVYKRAYEVYSRLGSWLSKDTPKGELKNHYTELGRVRCREGIPLHEVVMVLMLVKRHLWLYVLETQLPNTSYELYQNLELNNRVVLFFDRAIFFTTMGYEEELRKDIGRAALAVND
ncbi:MAG: hypothetical protein JW920_01005 [Deltaproteobacteria bacterium]|nr:hypothetical protein [Deltaproteobacteria bacterium]